MKNNINLVKNIFFLKNQKNNYLYKKIEKMFIILIISSFFKINTTLKILTFLNKNKINNKNLNYFFFTWKKYLVIKIKFRHKVSWLKIFRKKNFFIKFNFGFSYNIFMKLNNIFFKKKKKYLTYNDFIFWDINLKNIFFITSYIKNIQSFNQYTLRGFRFSKQKFIKRIGKISKYTEFKSKIF